jgi:hypothetical protein
MKKIIAEVIPHKKQRYETPGDYYMKNGNLIITSSKLKNWKYEMPIIIHEFVEFLLIKKRGITIKEVEDFDLKWNKERENGLHKVTDEPGFNKRSPYRKEHRFATKIEKMLVKELGLSWKEYNDNIQALYKKKK